jgi:hypothetical protein
MNTAVEEKTKEETKTVELKKDFDKLPYPEKLAELSRNIGSVWDCDRPIVVVDEPAKDDKTPTETAAPQEEKKDVVANVAEAIEGAAAKVAIVVEDAATAVAETVENAASEVEAAIAAELSKVVVNADPEALSQSFLSSFPDKESAVIGISKLLDGVVSGMVKNEVTIEDGDSIAVSEGSKKTVNYVFKGVKFGPTGMCFLFQVTTGKGKGLKTKDMTLSLAELIQAIPTE